jgi:hypothetical protein
VRKPRADSFWDQQPPARLAELERWLFDENLSYEAALKKWAELYDACGSLASLARWRSGLAQERMLEKIASSAKAANSVVEKFQENPSNTYAALLQMIGQAAFDAHLNGKSDLDLSTLKDLAELTSVGLKARHDTASLALKQEDIRLKRDRFEFDAAKAALAKLPELRAIAGNKALDQTAKIQAVRERLFGAAIAAETT